MLAAGVERILLLDWDVHHGDGTQQVSVRPLPHPFSSPACFPLCEHEPAPLSASMCRLLRICYAPHIVVAVQPPCGQRHGIKTLRLHLVAAYALRGTLLLRSHL